MYKFKVILLNPPHLKSVQFNREGRCQQKVSSFGYLMVPMSLIYIAALLRENGFPVEIIDGMAGKKYGIFRLLNKLEQIAPSIIIMSLSTPTFGNDIKVVELIKNRTDAHISAIGIHGTVLPQNTLSRSFLDSVIRGEPELTSLELVQALNQKIDLQNIKGLSYKDNGKIRHNPDRPLIENLDILPFPTRDLIRTDWYRLPMNNQPYTLIIPSRGCWHDCIFCQAKNYYGKHLRLRSVNNIIAEIEEIIARFNIRNISMLSDNFTANKEFVIQFCEELLRSKLKISWMANSRVDSVDYSLLSLMKKAGCYGISYGVESGDQRILDRTKKGITIAQTEEAFRWSHKLGIKTLAQVILGLPGENRDTINQTLDLLININPDFVQFNCAVAYPGTELFDLTYKNTYIEHIRWETFEPNKAVINTDELSSDQIMSLKIRCYLKFYFRPKYLMRLFKLLIKDIKISKNMVINLIIFFREWVYNNEG